MSAIDIDTDNSNLVKPFMTCPSSDLLMSLRISINAKNDPAKTAPLAISPMDRYPISLVTPTSIPIAITRDFRPSPRLATPSPHLAPINPIIKTNVEKPVAKATPLSISSAESIPIIFTTPAISNIAVAIFFIILPSLSIFLELSSLTKIPKVAIMTAREVTIPAKPAKPCSMSFKSILPSILTVVPISNIAVPIEVIPAFNPSILIPCLSIVADAAVILLIATAIPTSTPAITAVANPP